MARAPHLRAAVHSLVCLSLAVLLSGCGTGYQHQGNQMVFVTWDEGHGNVARPIPEADVGSFVVLNDVYAKDKRRIYYRGESVWGAAPDKPTAAQLASFVTLSYGYAKDGQFAYYQGLPFPADPATFHVGTQGNWSADKDDIYFENQAIHACDPASFESLDQKGYSGYWYRDARCLYARRNGKLVKLPETADPKTFVVINYVFGADDKHVYTAEGTVLAGADPKTFVQTGKDAYLCTRDDQPAACYPK